MKKMKQNKENPFRAYLARKGDARTDEDALFDSCFEEEGKLARARTLAINWDYMNQPKNNDGFQVYRSIERNPDWEMDITLQNKYKQIIDAVSNPEERTRLKCLGDIANDPVAQKLENYRATVVGRAFSSIGQRLTDEDLIQIYGIEAAYERLATRTMKHDEYEFLDKSDHSEYERMVGITGERK